VDLPVVAASEVQRRSLSFTAASEVHEGALKFGGEDPDRLGPISSPYIYIYIYIFSLSLVVC